MQRSLRRECPTRQGAGSFRAPCSRACHSSPHSGSPDSRTQPIGRVGTSPGMTKTLARGIAAPLCSFKTWPASMSAQSPKTIPNLCSAWRAAPGRTTKAREHPAELQYMTSLSARMASCRACSTTAPMTGGPLRRTDWRTDSRAAPPRCSLCSSTPRKTTLNAPSALYRPRPRRPRRPRRPPPRAARCTPPAPWPQRPPARPGLAGLA